MLLFKSTKMNNKQQLILFSVLAVETLFVFWVVSDKITAIIISLLLVLANVFIAITDEEEYK